MTSKTVTKRIRRVAQAMALLFAVYFTAFLAIQGAQSDAAWPFSAVEWLRLVLVALVVTVVWVTAIGASRHMGIGGLCLILEGLIAMGIIIIVFLRYSTGGRLELGEVMVSAVLPTLIPIAAGLLFLWIWGNQMSSNNSR